MDLSKLSVFQALAAKLGWLNARQKVLAENVANADTPGFRARDLRPPDFDGLLRELRNGPQAAVRIAATAPGHFATGAGAAAPGGAHRVETPRAAHLEVSPTGNAVVLEEEMLKVSRTAADYELTANLYDRSLGMLRLAIGKAGGRG